MRVGVDLVSIAVVRHSLNTSPRFATLTFSENELATAGGFGLRRRVEFLAGRFAAKEAVLKALGVGIHGNINPREIETLSSESGNPQVTLRGDAKKLARKLGLKHCELSISHEAGLAVAFAVLS
jgi:holo-[acyl-carrier protein] synthase